MAELDAIKRERIGGLMLRRDWGERSRGRHGRQPDEIDLTHMSRKMKEVIRAAGLRDELTFTSFRHGGFTEGGRRRSLRRRDAGAGAAQVGEGAADYAKRTMKQVEDRAKKRRAMRTKGRQLSE